jgi:hypothetical protein
MTAAAGTISLAEEALRVALADCAAFRTWVGAADRAEALESIYVDGLPAPAGDADVHTRAELEALRPYAILFTAEGDGVRRRLEAGGGTFCFDAGGRLIVRLVQDCPQSLDDQPTSWANQQWRQTVGLIRADLRQTAAQPNQAEYLAITRLAVASGPYWSPREVAVLEGVWQGVELEAVW